MIGICISLQHQKGFALWALKIDLLRKYQNGQKRLSLEATLRKVTKYSVLIRNRLWSIWRGNGKDFALSFDYNGTEFQQAVWKALCGIPYGQTKSYSDVANHINKPALVRAVGAAIGRNPILITVPCHRVIGKNGSINRISWRIGNEKTTS